MSSARPWSIDDIPDMSGQVAVVTGANSGIGYQTARALANAGARVVLACRNSAKANAAADAIVSAGASGFVEVAELDLSELSSVERFADGFLAEHDRLSLLINNAGVMMPKRRQQTGDGFELQIGVNHLGHFALTARLFPLLASCPSARVVSVASQAHRFGSVDFSDLNWEARPYRRAASYGQSKLANLLFAFELARKCSAAGSSLLSLAAHPGWTATELQRFSPTARFFNKFFAMRPSDGALPTPRAASGDDSRGGDYFGPDGIGELRGPPVKVGASDRARRLEDAERLWSLSEELTSTRFDVGAFSAQSARGL